MSDKSQKLIEAVFSTELLLRQTAAYMESLARSLNSLGLMPKVAEELFDYGEELLTQERILSEAYGNELNEGIKSSEQAMGNMITYLLKIGGDIDINS